MSAPINELNESALRPRFIAKDKQSSLDGHFLARRALTSRKTASLLLSSSFGANALLYATFLGYLMGLWALIVQLAWMASFFLLARFSRQIYASTSLHEFLQTRYGTATRRIAALCSVAGIAYFAGWEIAVARNSLQSLATLSGGAHAQLWQNLSIGLLVAVIVAAIAYTSAWGRRASGTVNVYLNAIKVTCLGIVGILLAVATTRHGLSGHLLPPPFSQAVLGVGVVGLLTNIIFNITWQFVDNSSWQSVSSNGSRSEPEVSQTIKQAGIWTLITVNGVGTLIGALMRSNSAVDSTNALGYAVTMSTTLQWVALVAMVVLLALSAMSLFDGAILSVSQSILVDLRAKMAGDKQITLLHARIATLVIGVIAAWGISLLIHALGGSIFNLVYIVIIAQLALAGPVIVGLLSPIRVRGMWAAIVLGLAAGMVSTVVGTVQDNQTLLQAAGTVTTAASVIVSVCLLVIQRRINHKRPIH